MPSNAAPPRPLATAVVRCHYRRTSHRHIDRTSVQPIPVRLGARNRSLSCYISTRSSEMSDQQQDSNADQIWKPPVQPVENTAPSESLIKKKRMLNRGSF